MSTLRVQVGEQAPAFELPDQQGRLVALSDFRGKRNVVLFFYPKDDTPGCRVEACAFRDSFEEFTDAGATVIGVSSDGVSSHAGFRSKYRLPFTLLADAGGEVRKRYGVRKTLGLFDGRVTFVIDKQGVVRRVFSSATRPKQHIREALATLSSLAD